MAVNSVHTAFYAIIIIYVSVVLTTANMQIQKNPWVLTVTSLNPLNSFKIHWIVDKVREDICTTTSVQQAYSHWIGCVLGCIIFINKTAFLIDKNITKIHITLYLHSDNLF